MEFPKDSDIDYQGLSLKLLILDGASLGQIDPAIHESANQAYEFCFRHPSYNVLQNLNEYNTRSGCSIVVIEPETNQTHFVLTLVKFPQTNSVEIYNVCKYQHSPISATDFLQIIIDDFCLDNPLFSGCRYLSLAMLCKSVFFFPAFISYCRLGFRVDSPILPLSSKLPAHFTMSRPLLKKEPVAPSLPEEEILKVYNGCFFSPQHLALLEDSIVQRKKEIDYSKITDTVDTSDTVDTANTADTANPTDTLSQTNKKSDMLQGLQRLRKVMINTHQKHIKSKKEK